MMRYLKKIRGWFNYRIIRKIFPLYKRKRVTLFRYTKALGDNLLLTTLAREIRKRNPNCEITVITGLPVLFERNPDVNKVLPEPEKATPGIGKYLIRYENRFPWKKHILNYSAECVDIQSDIELKTYIYPGNEDIKWANEFADSLNGQLIMINRIAGPRTDKKNWPEQYWKSLIDELLKKGYHLLDVGTVQASYIPEHPHFHNLVNKTTLHQLSALMDRSDLLIAPVTGTIHLAAASNVKVICILGGSEPKIGTAYPNVSYLEFKPPCNNCYEKGPCINDFECLWKIKPELVFQKVIELTNNEKDIIYNQ